ncbi:hypothetical protein SOVF_206360 [Spinacia oleracea]|nr:hypothetical protein SOVF_206360 [Spinacia oleracea]
MAEMIQGIGKAANAEVGLGGPIGYGKTWVKKITNKGKHVVHFVNPYMEIEGDVEPGKTQDDKDVHGYIPYWSNPEKYKIHYKNETLEKEVVVVLKDLGDRLMSFSQHGTELITEIASKNTETYFPVEIIVKDIGFEIYDLTNNIRKGGLFFW